MYYLYAPVGGYARSLSYAKISAKNFVMNLPFKAFPLPEKKFSKLHFFRQKWSAALRLPLGGKLCHVVAVMRGVAHF